MSLALPGPEPGNTPTAGRCVCGANAGDQLFCAVCDAAMGAQRPGRVALFGALTLTVIVTLAGCVPAGDPATGVDDVTPHSVAPQDFPDAPTSTRAPAGPFGCNPHGFGPLSGCAHGTVTGQADNAIATVPVAPLYLVTAKFHRGGEDRGWCVESRVPLDVQDRFSRTCVLDRDRTPADQDWLDHQVVGQPEWPGVS